MLVKFETGSRYRNRKGYYEVLEVLNEKIKVRFDDGSEQLLNKEIASRVHQNIKIEDDVKIPREYNHNPQDFTYTVAMIVKHGKLQATIPDKSWYGFKSYYERVTGIDIDEQHIVKHDDNKWGCELMIVLPKDVAYNCSFASDVNFFETGNQVRISNNKLWWHLVERLNFRFGNSQNINKIYESLPDKSKEQFSKLVG